MTDRELMSENHDCGADAPAYVLGALEPAEAEAFRLHLDSCVVCRDEVAAFQRTADALPMAAPQYPLPRGLRRRVVRAVRSEPRFGSSTQRPARSLSLRGGAARPAVALAAGLVAALAVVGAVELGSSGSSGPRVIQASVGNAELRLAGGRAELIVRHLPSPPAGRIYEVWLKRPNRPPAPTTALFSVTSSGAGYVGVPGDLSGVADVLVTPEPDGGSKTPTHAPVIVAPLS